MNFPKHVEFYSKNKFEKLVHLFGFVIRNPSEFLNFVITQLLAEINVFSVYCKLHLKVM